MAKSKKGGKKTPGAAAGKPAEKKTAGTTAGKTSGKKGADKKKSLLGWKIIMGGSGILLIMKVLYDKGIWNAANMFPDDTVFLCVLLIAVSAVELYIHRNDG